MKTRASHCNDFRVLEQHVTFTEFSAPLDRAFLIQVSRKSPFPVYEVNTTITPTGQTRKLRLLEMKGLEAQNSQTTESALLTPPPVRRASGTFLGFVFYILINLASIRHTHTEGTMQKVQRP